MRSYDWRLFLLINVILASAELFLSGCPLISQDPKVAIVNEWGQPVGRFLSLVSGATVTLQAQSTSPEDTFSWASSAPEVAKVEGLGLVTAVAPGTAVITATGLVSLGSDSVEVRVSPNTPGEGEEEGEGEDQAQAEGEGEEQGEAQDYTQGEDELVGMTPFSGLFGYWLEGPYGFIGSLTKQDLTDPSWRLEGDFRFPTAGYIAEEPVVRILESYPEQVQVSIGVIPPPPGGVVAQVITSAHVSADIPASNEAQFAIVVLTHLPPAPGEVSWIRGESSPPVWSIGPPNPMPGDVIHFSGPTTVYQNGCRALETLGQPQVHVDPYTHQIQLTFSPVNLFAACGDERDPVCGIEGRFGPLEGGDWVFSGHNPADPLVDFDITFHVGAAGPAWDEHVKPIPDDPDGNFLTDAEEQALGGLFGDPNENGEMVPAGIRLARHLFTGIAKLPMCPQPPEPSANGTVQETTPPFGVPLCKTVLEADCIETCSVCGEPYNCGGIVLTRQGSTDPATAGSDAPLELHISFAALHYMEHGSLSYKWLEGGYEERVDAVALASFFIALPPPPPPDPIVALIWFLMGADADGNGCLSFAETQTAIPSIDQELFDLLANLCPNVLAGVSWPDMSSEICPSGGVYAPPEALIPLLAKAVALADRNGDGMLSLDEVQTLIPGLPPELFALLDQNGDGVISAADIPQPPPPPPDPVAELLNLLYQADTDYNGCLSLAELQALVPAMDENLFGLLKQIFDCAYVWMPMMDGTLPGGMPNGNEICICGNWSLTPDLVHAIGAAILAIADTDGDQALSFAEAQAFMPPLTERIFGFLDRNGDGVLSALDIPEIPPPPPPDPLSALIRAILQADTDGNGCLSLPELQTLVPAMDENLFGLLKQAFDCPFIQPGMDGTDPNGMPESNEICFCGNTSLTPDLIHAIAAAVLAVADTNGDHALSLEEAQAFVPALTDAIFSFLDRNGDGVLSAADIPEIPPPPLPMHWMPDGQCPAEWIVFPQPPAPHSLHFAGPTGTFGNECEAVAALGMPHLVIDGAQHRVELKFEPLPEPVSCPAVFDPVCGLEGNFGPLPPGAWVFFAQSPAISFAVSFVVEEPGGLDPHLIPVPNDLDGDFLSGDEEQRLERNPENPDENANGIPDGIDLARRIANRIEELPWFNAAGDPQDGLNPPELEQQFPTDRSYVIHFDYLLDCIWICPVCQATVPAGHLQIVNPAIHASWRDGFRIPLSAWHFLRHTSFSHPGAGCGAFEEGRIDVVGLVRTLAAAPEHRVEVQWIPGETGPNQWAVEILPLGMPLNGIRIAGPTQVFGNQCEGQAALGGHPIIIMDANAHSITLTIDGPAPEVCAEVYAPVCGLAAQIIGIANGVWTFSAPILDPPVHLTFTVGAK